MPGKLQNKVAIVTGGNSGIGEAAVRLFAEEGAKVAIMARREEQGEAVQNAVRDQGGIAEFIRCDVTEPQEVSAAVEKVVEVFGGVDVLFNNAGTAGPESFPEESREQWDNIIDVNLNGVFEMSTKVWPYMVERGGGAIVNMSSGAAVGGFTPFLKGILGRVPPASYYVAKAGVDALTRWTAGLGGEVNIRVNGVRPGQIITPMVDREGTGRHGLEKLFDAIQIMDGRGYPIDVAKAVLFLSCEDSRFVTGEILNIDGGLVAKL